MVEDGKNLHYWIKYYVPLVNKEFGLSDKNKESIDFFERLIPYSDSIIDDKHYIWVLPSKDMWGEKYLMVVSYYIKPEHRTVGFFRKTQDEIISLAKKHKVGYIIQGSYLNDKLNSVLGKIGYKVAQMVRRV